MSIEKATTATMEESSSSHHHHGMTTRVKRSSSSGSVGGSDHGGGGSGSGSPATWDSDAEHFHILSYFMGGETTSNSSHGHGNSGFVTTTTDGSASPRRTLSGSFTNPSSSSSAHPQPVEPPPTPAVQFYSHHASSSHPGGTSPGMGSARAPPPLTASSSSSSLSSMAAALVSGGAVVHSMYNANNPNRKDSPLSPSMMHTSPISPAGMIGPNQENLMLPPPPRFPKGTQGPSVAKPAAPQQQTESSLPPEQHQQPQQQHPALDPEQKQRHMAWLQHLNSMAMMAHNSSTGQPHQQQQPPMQPPPGQSMSAFPHGNMPPLQGPLAPTPVFTHVPPAAAAPVAPMGETEERRARRLKRNRESARQSRRRKKEHLQKLAQKVNRLHNEIETERRKQLCDMESSLARLRQEKVESCFESEELTSIIQRTSPNCHVRRSIISFQYIQLKQLLLPKHQEFLLWLTRQPESYFLAGKEERAKSVAEKQTTRVSSGRVSSKQIGEDLTNEFKKQSKQKKQPIKREESATSPSTSPTPGENKGYITARAHDAAQMWPLLCYELSVSVDQEERLLQAHKKTSQLPNLANDCSQMAVATRMSSSMRNGVLYQAHTANHRMQSGLLHILTPQQSQRYLKWFDANRQRIRNVVMQTQTDKKETSLTEVCRKLERVLRIPETETTSQMEIKKEEE